MKENTSRLGQYGLFGLGKNMVSMIVMVLALCAVSFYLGGAYYGIPENGDGSVVFDRAGCIPLQKVEPFPECNLTTQDMTPCTDPKASLKSIALYCRRNSTVTNRLPDWFRFAEMEQVPQVEDGLQGAALSSSLRASAVLDSSA